MFQSVHTFPLPCESRRILETKTKEVSTIIAEIERLEIECVQYDSLVQLSFKKSAVRTFPLPFTGGTTGRLGAGVAVPGDGEAETMDMAGDNVGALVSSQQISTQSTESVSGSVHCSKQPSTVLSAQMSTQSAGRGRLESIGHFTKQLSGSVGAMLPSLQVSTMLSTGALVGGSTVGVKEGFDVGLEDGLADGTKLGLGVGAAVGLVLGSDEGVSLGTSLGTSLGIALGKLLGMMDGVVEWAIVGSTEGGADGSTVGSAE